MDINIKMAALSTLLRAEGALDNTARPQSHLTDSTPIVATSKKCNEKPSNTPESTQH